MPSLVSTSVIPVSRYLRRRFDYFNVAAIGKGRSWTVRQNGEGWRGERDANSPLPDERLVLAAATTRRALALLPGLITLARLATGARLPTLALATASRLRDQFAGFPAHLACRPVGFGLSEV